MIEGFAHLSNILFNEHVYPFLQDIVYDVAKVKLSPKKRDNACAAIEEEWQNSPYAYILERASRYAFLLMCVDMLEHIDPAERDILCGEVEEVWQGDYSSKEKLSADKALDIPNLSPSLYPFAHESAPLAPELEVKLRTRLQEGITAEFAFWQGDINQLQARFAENNHYLERFRSVFSQQMNQRPEVHSAFVSLLLVQQLTNSDQPNFALSDDFTEHLKAWQREFVAAMKQKDSDLAERLEAFLDKRTSLLAIQIKQSEKALGKKMDSMARDVRTLLEKHEPTALAIPKRRYIAGTFVEARAFQGRAEKLVTLKHYLIEQHNTTLVQIYAPVGRGKSALAYHFVKQIETSYRDSFTGIVVMSLREATADSFELSFFTLLRQVIPTEKVKPLDAILQQPEQEGSSKVAQIVQRILVDERILVVLDNVEDALDESNHIRNQYRVVLEMLKYSLASQHVHFLLTSRRPLETDITNLGNYSKKVKLYGLEDKESIALIHDLQDDDDDFKLEAVDTLNDILNHDLQGLPLNIVTLASYLKTKGWTLPRYLSQPERLAALKDDASKVLYESRNAEEQRIMQVLAIFQQPVPLQALEYILPEIAELSELCDRLEQHLVVLVAKDELGIPSSYALRPVDGEYVLRQVEDAKALHKQAAIYYLQQASEIQDMLDAFNQLMKAEEFEQAAITLKSVDGDLELRGESRRRLKLWQQLEDKPLSQESKAKRLYRGLAVSSYRLGKVRKAIAYYQQAIKISQEIGDRRAEGSHLGNLGLAYAALGEVQQAIDYHQQAIKISREIGDRRGEGYRLGNLGNAYRNLGEVQQAITYYQQALTIAKEIGNRRAEGAHLGNLGLAYADLGEVEQAIDYHQQALTIAKEIGDRRGEGNRLGNLGNAYFDLGEVEQAIDYHQQALSISQEIGDRRGEGNSLGNLGISYHSLGEVQQAIDYYQQALKIAQEIDDRRGEGNGLANLGQVAKSQQNIQGAMAMWFVSLTIYMQIQTPTAQSVLQWLQQSHAGGTDVPAILLELFSENGAVGDRILKEATGIDYRFYREMPASYAEEVIALLHNPPA